MGKNPDSRVALPIHAIPGKELHENGYDENGPGVRDRTTECESEYSQRYLRNSLPRTAIAAVPSSHAQPVHMGRVHQRNSLSPLSRVVCEMRAEPTDNQDTGLILCCLCSSALVPKA